MTRVADTYLGDLGVAVPPSQLVTVLVAFWFGMEQQHLIGVPESDSPFLGVLDAVGSWLEAQERSVAAASVKAD